MTGVTRILSQLENGDSSSAAELLPLVYDELRKLAAARMAREQPGQTLQATALVHEAYLRLVDVKSAQHWSSRRHFFAAAAESMRRILIDVARHKKTEKAGGKLRRIDLEDARISLTHTAEELITLDDAITELLADDPIAGEIAKLRLYAGMNVDEAADILDISRRSGFRHWTYARAFLQLRFQSKDQESNHP